VVPGFSLPSNCEAEGVIPSDFPVEDQLNPLALCFGVHPGGRGSFEKLCDFARSGKLAQKMRGNSQLLQSANSSCP
jgi:hypothetical protein